MFFCQRPADHQKSAARVFEINRVRDAVHQRLQQKPFMVVAQLKIMTVQRLAHGGVQRRRGQLRFEQIILRSQRDGPRGDLFLRRFRQHDHRRLRGGGMNLIEGDQSLAVGQNQIHQDQVIGMGVKSFQSGGQMFRAHQFKNSGHEQRRAGGSLFDQQQFGRGFRHRVGNVIGAEFAFNLTLQPMAVQHDSLAETKHFAAGRNQQNQ